MTHKTALLFKNNSLEDGTRVSDTREGGIN